MTLESGIAHLVRHRLLPHTSHIANGLRNPPPFPAAKAHARWREMAKFNRSVTTHPIVAPFRRTRLIGGNVIAPVGNRTAKSAIAEGGVAKLHARCSASPSEWGWPPITTGELGVSRISAKTTGNREIPPKSGNLYQSPEICRPLIEPQRAQFRGRPRTSSAHVICISESV